MRKVLSVFIVCLLSLTLSACSQPNENEGENINPADEIVEPEIVEPEENMETGSDAHILIAYFTYGENANLSNGAEVSSSASIQNWNGEVTGNAGVLAHMIHDAIEADLFSIRTVDPYPSTYDETVAQGRSENDADARPALAVHIENLDQYDTIFIGFPNWWYDLPMAMYSFFEEYDFSGKTIIPFSTSGGSGFSDILQTISELEPNATLLEGLTINSSQISEAQNDVDAWLSSLGYGQ